MNGANCLEGYENIFQDGSESTGKIDPLMLYFVAAEQSRPGVSAHICAGHLLQSLITDELKVISMYSGSLYSEVQLDADKKIPSYVTIIGSASYVKKRILRRYEDDEWKTTKDYVVDWGDNTASPDVRKPATHPCDLAKRDTEPANEVTLPGSVNGGSAGAVSAGMVVSAGSGGSGGSSGSSGSSGLSAVTVAFLGAVTFAAAFCRRP